MNLQIFFYVFSWYNYPGGRKVEKNVRFEKSSIIISILFFLLGLILFIDFNKVINFVSYVLGTIIIALGVYKLWSYYRKKLNNDLTDYNEFGFGVVDLILGILIIVLAEAFTTILRFFVGGYILLAGINRFVQTMSNNELKRNKFISLLLMSIIVIGLGVYTILNKNSLDIIGLLIMIYSVIEIIESIMFRTSNKKEEINNEVIEVEVVEKKKNSKKK